MVRARARTRALPPVVVVMVKDQRKRRGDELGGLVTLVLPRLPRLPGSAMASLAMRSRTVGEDGVGGWVAWVWDCLFRLLRMARRGGYPPPPRPSSRAGEAGAPWRGRWCRVAMVSGERAVVVMLTLLLPLDARAQLSARSGKPGILNPLG